MVVPTHIRCFGWKLEWMAHSGSNFYNFKGFFSVVLFALVDAHTRFIYINVGANGKTSDSTIFQSSFLYNSIKNKTLNIPRPKKLSDRLGDIPYFFIGDDAFSLSEFLMKPYNRNLKLSVAEEIFNYRLCRARMTVEMAFGRLTNRFRIFHKPIEVSPLTCDKIIRTCCTIHNFLTIKRTCSADIEETAVENIPGHITSLQTQEYNCYKFSNQFRDKLASYCIQEGDVKEQWKKIGK